MGADGARVAASGLRSTGKEFEPFAGEATRLVRVEMVKRGVSFRELADRLNERGDGPGESVQTLINKINRGRFTLAFFLRVCRALDLATVDVAAVRDPLLAEAGTPKE